MTRDDIIRMARKMGGFYDRHPACINDHFVFPTEESLERFANLVAAAEREACAMEADYEAARWAYSPEAREPCEEVAKAIRARGNT